MSDQGYGPSGHGGGYGDPQYPSDPHGNQYGSQYGSHAAPSGGSGQRGIFIALGAVVVAGLVVLVLAVTGVFSGSGSTPTDNPKQVVEKVLFASKKQNLEDVKAAVCKKDLANPDLADIVGKDHATSYSIGSVTEQGDERAVVDVRVTTSDNETDSAKLAVVKEDGAWKVCFSDTRDSTGLTSSSNTPPPTTEITDPSTTSTPTPTGSSTDSTFSFCGTQQSAADTAKTFISFITLSSTKLAGDCVYPGKLSTEMLDMLTGDVYSPSQNDGQPGPRFQYKSSDGGSTIYVLVEKQSDGKYYVTAATKR